MVHTTGRLLTSAALVFAENGMNKIPLMRIQEPTPPPPLKGFALWRLGFRPFYFLGSLYALFNVVVWALQFTGLASFTWLTSAAQHGHEMLFGFTSAIIAGFLLTAVRAWTGQTTIEGKPLAALVALWLCGRVLVYTPWGLAATACNMLFLLAVALAIADPLLKSKNQRNYFFVGLLALMAMAGGLVQLALRGIVSLPAQFGLQLALDVVLFIMTVMGGRVIPMFTSNGVPGTKTERLPWLEKSALGAVILIFLADLVGAPALLLALLAWGAALLHGYRFRLWQPWRTFKTPLVWVLHTGYAWIVIHLILRGIDALWPLGGSFATHALTVGAIGALTLGMMTRTARGHTGRRLLADRFEVAMFILINLAALIRVWGGLLAGSLYLPSVAISGLLWSSAYGLYAWRYWPILSQPRVDGKPG